MLFGVVFAGGRSSRMGEDKAAMEWQGMTLLDRARQTLLDVGVDRVLISGRPALSDGIPDLFEFCGPPAGLYSTLTFLKAQPEGVEGHQLLVIPVDMPLLSMESLKRLLEVKMTSGCLHFEREVFPCLIQCSGSLYEHLHSLFSDDQAPGGQRSMKAIFKFMQAKALATDGIDEQEFSNMNTPEDWQVLG